MLVISAFALSALMIAHFNKRRLEETLPLVLLGCMTILTVLAMLEKLDWIDAIALAVNVIVLLVFIINGFRTRPSVQKVWKGALNLVLTPGMVCLVAVLAFYWWASSPMSVWWRDDLAHWGLQVKALWFYNG